MVEIYSSLDILEAGYPESLFLDLQRQDREFGAFKLDTDKNELKYYYNFIGEDILGHFDGDPMVPLYVVMGHMSRAAQIHSKLLYKEGTPMVSSFENPRFAYRKPRAGDSVRCTSLFKDEKYKVRLKSQNVNASMVFTIDLVD